jgi:ribosomal protein S18 acetylase RimI-like enzyme
MTIMPVTKAAEGGFALGPAADHEVGQIAAVWHEGWHEVHRGHVPAALLRSRELAHLRERVPRRLAATTVARVDDEVVGFVVVDGAQLEQIYVARVARGSGVAAGLLEHAERTIARSHPRAWLAVVASNGRARTFYERHGWRDQGPFENLTWTNDGTPLTVPCRRYEKAVGRPSATEDPAA